MAKMIRDTKEDKPDFDLLFPKNVKFEDTLLYQVAIHLAQGARKYTERNWENASIKDIHTFRKGLYRHTIQLLTGQTDENHIGAIFFNLNGLNFCMKKYDCDVYGDKIVKAGSPN